MHRKMLKMPRKLKKERKYGEQTKTVRLGNTEYQGVGSF